MQFSHKKITILSIIGLTLFSVMLSLFNYQYASAGYVPNLYADWTSVKYPITKQTFSQNGQGAMTIYWGNDPKYIQSIKRLNPGTIRFHDSIQGDAPTNWRAWANNSTKSWDRAKIRQFADMVRNWRAQGITSEFSITLTDAPAWMKRKSFVNSSGTVVSTILDQTEYENFTKFSQDLVKIINQEEQLNIKTFEILNERDFNYSVNLEDNGLPRQMTEMGKLYNQVVKGMKQIQPNLVIGGPSLARTERMDGVKEFLTEVAKEKSPKTLDFLSYHIYISGSKTDTDTDIFYRATMYPFWSTSSLKSALIEKNINVPIHLNEFNISWEANDPRMANQKGAVFDALTVISALQNGASNVAAWTDVDINFGKMNPTTYQIRPAGQVWSMLSDLPEGNIISTQTNDPDIFALAVVSKDNTKRSIVLVNQSTIRKDMTINKMTNNTNIGFKQLTLAGNTIVSKSITPQYTSPFSLPATSVSVLEFTGPFLANK